MIFYHPDCDLLFSRYGIEIPVEDNRAQTIFSKLQAIDLSLSSFDPDIIPKITKEDLLLVHDKNFVDRLFMNEDELTKELIICYELIDVDGKYYRYNPKNARENLPHAFLVILKQTGMTYYSTKEAFKNGFSYFLGGGMHHAMSFGGRGFCLINDIVIAIRKLQIEKLIKTAWVIDVDAHKGDGTAELSKNDSSIVTLSIHMKKGWPLDSGEISDPWYIPSDIDIEIDSGEEEKYLYELKNGLDKLLKHYPLPDVAIIVSGADPYLYDELPSTEKLKLTREQLLKRDQLVYEFLKNEKIPQSYLMAGGYGKKSWEIYTQFLEFVWKNSSEGSEVSSR